MPRLFGYLPDPAGEERGLEVGGLVGAPRATLPEAHAIPVPGEVLSQNFANCVNCAFWCALASAGLVANRHIDISVTATYALARELEKPGSLVLADVGCYPNKAIQALEVWGPVARHRWRDDADPTKPVPIDVLEAGAIAKVGGIFRIYETGAARVHRVKQALAQDHGVVFAMQVTATFEELADATVYDGAPGERRTGGHAQCLVAYRPGAFRVRGSWGKAFGDGGDVWIAESYIASDECTDFTIVTIAPEAVR